jgi:hypothetical protein
MNVADKTRLVAELRRMLVPGGRLAVHEVVGRQVRPLRYPLPWARSPLTHFLATPRRLRVAISSAGFRLKSWQDTTAAALEWWRAVAASCGDDAARAAWETLLGEDAAAMIDNVVDNLESGRMGVVMAVFVKPSSTGSARSARPRVRDELDPPLAGLDATQHRGDGAPRERRTDVTGGSRRKGGFAEPAIGGEKGSDDDERAVRLSGELTKQRPVGDAFDGDNDDR